MCATVLVGEDPAFAVYVANKQRACAEVGIQAFDYRLAATTSQAKLAALIASLNADASHPACNHCRAHLANSGRVGYVV